MTLAPAPPSTSDSSSQLQLAYQRLLALERFKSGFLARTAHELRSPVNTIISLHQLILEDLCEDPAEEREFIGQSKAAALKMLALFDQVAAVSKLDVGREPPKLAAVDLSFLLPEIEMLTALQAANQNVRYSVEAPTDTLEVVTDAKWLKNIVVSLIQDTVAQTKLMSLAVEQTENQITLVIDSDRTAERLQTELHQVSDYTDAEPEAPEPEAPEPEAPEPQTSEIAKTARSLDASSNIQLSTGLILATAHIALPLIKGEFKITPHPDSAERSQLRCEFHQDYQD